MLKHLKPILMGCLALAIATPALAQVKQSREQILFYTSQWKGDRFPDDRDEVPLRLRLFNRLGLAVIVTSWSRCRCGPRLLMRKLR